MVSSKDSPKRRQSIAFGPSSKGASTKTRRRAHSLAPAAALSPLSRSRRSTAPRKSILKRSSMSQTDTFSQPTSTQSSMEMTVDFTEPIRDHTSRKSMGRRVSFASQSSVRLIEAKPSSSPGSAQDENEPPSRSRRSSVRRSIGGSDDMEMTSIFPSNYGGAILDEEFDWEDGDMEGEMDVTEAIPANMARRRSSAGGLSKLKGDESQHDEEDGASEADVTRSSAADESIRSDDGGPSQPMEFTVPLGQSLRPADQDPTWLALKQMANSGNEAGDEDPDASNDSGMGLDDAMERLRRARDSLVGPRPGEPSGEDSFSSTASFPGEDDGIEDGNKTLNLSRVLGRVSMGNLTTRMSLGQGSEMDESEVYGAPQVAPLRRQSLVPPPPSNGNVAPEAEPSVLPTAGRRSIFQPPTTTANEPAPTTPKSTSFTFTAHTPVRDSSLPPETPSKSKPKPKFTAAFAPPTTRPSPKKPQQGPVQPPAPSKRPRTPTADLDAELDKPTPAKRQALVSKWVHSATETSTSGPSSETPKPGQLVASKKAIFETPEKTEQPKSSLRRPTNYFAKRKSVAFGSSTEESTSTTAPTSSVKKASLARASLGSAPADAWTRFDKSALPPIKPPSKDHDKENEVEPIVDPSSPPTLPPVSSSPPQTSPPTESTPLPPAAPVQSLGLEQASSSANSKSRLSTIAEDEPSSAMDVDMEDMEATRRWRDEVEPVEEDEEEIPAIAISQFFMMTGIRFMDEITAPRRSVYPSQLLRQPRNPSEIPLSEYVVATAIDIPQLDLYTRISTDLEAWMEKSKSVFGEAEEEAEKVTPELFVEYVRADEEGQMELLHQLKLIQANTRYSAKSDWYDWKLKWVEGLYATADESLRSLERDAQLLEEMSRTSAALIPELEKECEELLTELEREQAQVAEIEQCDQEFLNELKSTIADLSIMIEAFQAESQEGKEQLKWLAEKKEELLRQKKNGKARIAAAQRTLSRNQLSTRSEVFKLKDELEALEALTKFRISKLSPTMFEFVYGSRTHISVPCVSFKPIAQKIKVAPLTQHNTRAKDDFPHLTQFFLDAARHYIVTSNPDDVCSLRHIVQRTCDFFSSVAQLRRQILMLSVKFPLEIKVYPPSKANPEPVFSIQSMVLFKTRAAKAFVTFMLGLDSFGCWPLEVCKVGSEVEVVYGDVDREELLKAVTERLGQVTPADNYGCLLDACLAAQDVYRPAE